VHRLPDVYSDDLTKIHQHKETGEISTSMPIDSTTAEKPVEPDAMPKKIQLSRRHGIEDRLDKKICPWDAIKMYELRMA
jgi:hypothetical protein